jgi:hypothetical protein
LANASPVNQHDIYLHKLKDKFYLRLDDGRAEVGFNPIKQRQDSILKIRTKPFPGDGFQLV